MIPARGGIVPPAALSVPDTVKLFNRLPPIHALGVFHAVARLGSFTLAAQQLHVTQSAVSKQIRSLEEQLGMALFRRKSRGVALTAQGELLVASAERVLEDLQHTIQQARSLGRDAVVRIVCTEAVAHYWLAPRLSQLAAFQPGLKVNVFTTNDIDLLDMDDYDFGILYGDGRWPQLYSHELFAEVVYPVCHVDYPVDEIHSPADLLRHRLIQLNPEIWKWATWKDWLSHFGVAYQPGEDLISYNQATLAIAAALNKQGIALGWEFMLGDLLRNGLIRKAADFKLVSGRSDYLVYRQDEPLSPPAALFRDWLLAGQARAAASREG